MCEDDDVIFDSLTRACLILSCVVCVDSELFADSVVRTPFLSNSKFTEKVKENRSETKEPHNAHEHAHSFHSDNQIMITQQSRTLAHTAKRR